MSNSLSDLRLAFFGTPAEELAALEAAILSGFTFSDLFAGGPTVGLALETVELVAAVDAVFHLSTATAPTGGTFTLTYQGQTTTALAFDADATAVQTALRALSNIGATDVTVTGGPLGTADFVVTFVNALAGQPITGFTADGALLEGEDEPYVIDVDNTVEGVTQVRGIGWV